MNRLTFLKTLGLIAFAGPKLMIQEKPKYICVYDPVSDNGNGSMSAAPVLCWKLYSEGSDIRAKLNQN
jgi:hypothetical protein